MEKIILVILIFLDSDNAHHLCKKQYMMKSDCDRKYYFLKVKSPAFLSFPRFLDVFAMWNSITGASALLQSSYAPLLRISAEMLRFSVSQWRSGQMVICCFVAHYSAGIVAVKREALKKSYSPYSVKGGISISLLLQIMGYIQQKRKSFLEEFTSQIFQSTWHCADVTKRQS